MERLLSAALNGEPREWPVQSAEADAASLSVIARHGIQALVADRVHRQVLFGVPVAVRQALSRSAIQQAAVEELISAELRRVLVALAGASVPALLMKGGALAYTHYADPAQRPRTDTDLMLRRADLTRASRALEHLGYEPFNGISGDLVASQCTWTKTDPLGLRHVYDLHWKIVNPHVAADLVSWDDAAAHAIAIPRLGPGARGFGAAHALLLACVHRLAHHFDDDRLLWLYDIHLLASAMSDVGWRDFTRVADDPAAAAMCRRSLAAASAWFDTAVPAGVACALDARADDRLLDAFSGGTRRVDLLLSDLRAVGGWRGRMRLLREHLLPPAGFMRTHHGVTSPLLLPLLYVRRAAAGTRRWFRPLVR